MSRRLLFIALFVFALPCLAENQGLTLEQAIEQALSKSPTVRVAEAESRGRKTANRLGLSPFLPQIALETGYETRQSDQESQKGAFAFGVGRINLYNGGRDYYQRLIVKKELERTDANLELTKTRVTQDVAKFFFELLYVSEAIRLKEEALSINETQRQMARRIAGAGFTSNADVYEFDFRESELKTELTLLNHERNVGARNLSIAIGSEPNKDLRIDGDFDRDSSFVRGTATTNVVAPMQALLTAEKDFEISEFKYRSALATWLPKADIVGQYGHLEYADPEIKGVPAWSLSLRLTIPLFSGLETLSNRRVEFADVTRNEARLRQSRLDLKSQSEDNNEKIAVLANLITLQKTNMERAERYYKATLAEYKRGVKNAPDLAGATERFFSSRDRNFQLKRDQILAYLGLYHDPSPSEAAIRRGE